MLGRTADCSPAWDLDCRKMDTVPGSQRSSVKTLPAFDIRTTTLNIHDPAAGSSKDDRARAIRIPVFVPIGTLFPPLPVRQAIFAVSVPSFEGTLYLRINDGRDLAHRHAFRCAWKDRAAGHRGAR